MYVYFSGIRCIRERNCGTGYQVDPDTQTCMGRSTYSDSLFDNCIDLQMWMNANKILMNVGKWKTIQTTENIPFFFIFRPGYTCKNVPGTYKYYSSLIFLFLSNFFLSLSRCVPQNCTFGEKFNALHGRCEKILCQPGYNVTAFGKCVGKMNGSFADEMEIILFL